jgi:zinc transport system ATP-binding protein
VRREIDIVGDIPAVQIENLSFGYNKKLALSDINLTVKQGEFVLAIGPNGGGKTTLFRIILGVLNSYRGTVRVFGRPAKETPHRRGLVGYLPQQHNLERRFPIVAREVIQLGLYGSLGILHRPGKAERKAVLAIAERLDLSVLLEEPLEELSTGQQQRVFLARAIVSHPRLLLLDEPMVGVDEGGRSHLLDTLVWLKNEEQVTIIASTHNILSLGRMADYIACLDQTIHFHDVPGKLSQEKLMEVYQCDYVMLQELAGLGKGS